MKYVALLRGINVGGHNVNMAELKTKFIEWGFADALTYIQTGNVVFSTNGDRHQIQSNLESKLEAWLGYAVAVFLLTASELREAEARNPFEPAKHDPEQLCHLMFLSAEPDAEHAAVLMAQAAPEYRFHIFGRVLYYVYGREWAGGQRRQLNFEKLLGVKGTTRTWKVVNKLAELAES